MLCVLLFVVKQKTAYEMRISDWSSDVCSSDLKTAELFTADGWLRTGDMGRIVEDGYLYFTGRTKDIFKTLKGKYVAPAPIEGALSRDTNIDQLFFVGDGQPGKT